ncbi:MAG TPA: anti-sigma factor [Actinomycetales bacterium]|nr:anti-sigma factor [Actinomycetales bacterium]
MTDESDVHSLTGAYSLDALDDVERARVERHLEDCAACAAEVRSFHETAARLGAGAAVSPPPGLRDRVMAEVAHTRQLPPTSQPTPPRNRSASRATRWLGVAASSLLVLSLGLGATAWSQYSRATEARQAAEGMSEILSDPQRQVTDADFGAGHGTIVVAGDRVVLLGDDVEPPPEGMTFQLWLIGDEGPRPSVLLEATGDGDYWAAADGVRPGDEFGVTIEQAGGAQTPSDELVLITA